MGNQKRKAKRPENVTHAKLVAGTEPACPLCLRPIPASQFDRHHLIPKSKGGKSTEGMHRACHRHIHMVLTEQELAKVYNTPEALLEREEISTFVEWIKGKPNDFLPAFKQSNRTKR